MLTNNEIFAIMAQTASGTIDHDLALNNCLALMMHVHEHPDDFITDYARDFITAFLMLLNTWQNKENLLKKWNKVEKSTFSFYYLRNDTLNNLDSILSKILYLDSQLPIISYLRQ